MKLYTTPVSPNCRKAEATIDHLNLEVEIISKGLTNGDLETPEYLQINPNGAVPALEDGELKLWESNAIVQYLADQANAEAFFPRDLKKRTNIVRWQFWGCLHFNRAVGTIVWETVAKPLLQLGAPVQAVIDGALDNFHRYAQVLEQQLDHTRFIAGDSPTLADFSVGDHSALVLLEQSQVPLHKYPNIKSWYHRLEAVPAWEKTRPSW